MVQNERLSIGGLKIDPVFHGFVEKELLQALGFDSATFWLGVEAIIADLTPVNRELLKVRDDLQAKLDNWHRENPGVDCSQAAYREFLLDIGYLKKSNEFPLIETQNVDAEIAEIAGPQLVVPVSNARFAINAANARWGSLYDALYGTDVIPDEPDQARDGGYNPARGAAVIRYATEFLDRTIPLEGISHTDVNTYGLDRTDDGVRFIASQANGETRGLHDPKQFVGCAEKTAANHYLFRNHGLHIELKVDPDQTVVKDASAIVADVM